MAHSCSRLHHNVINVDFNIYVDEIMKDCHHDSLKGSPSIFESKRHNDIVKIANGGVKSNFLCIVKAHIDLVISVAAIHKRVHFATSDVVHQHIHVRDKEFILRACLVEVVKVNAAPDLPILLSN
ncbi:hypothetical protein SLE2022_211050 [Rubroshorea leprosula]